MTPLRLEYLPIDGATRRTHISNLTFPFIYPFDLLLPWTESSNAPPPPPLTIFPPISIYFYQRLCMQSEHQPSASSYHRTTSVPHSNRGPSDTIHESAFAVPLFLIFFSVAFFYFFYLLRWLQSTEFTVSFLFFLFFVFNFSRIFSSAFFRLFAHFGCAALRAPRSVPFTFAMAMDSWMRFQ